MSDSADTRLLNSRDPHPGLELLTHRPVRASAGTPLLFVHGAFAAAWCWEEHFLPFFAKAGFNAHALSLSGHGASRGRERLDSLSIADYVRDVREIVDQLPSPPILIGHSMGGFVVQKYLERFDAPGAVLMCPVPPQGLMTAAFGLLFSKPGLLRDLNTMLSGGRTSYDTMREAMFAQEISLEDLKRFSRQSQPESHRALWDMTLFGLPNTLKVKRTPLCVIGAEHDHLIPASSTQMTARTYGVDATIFPGMGHGLMLERDWRLVAEHIRKWIGGLDP